MVYEVVQDVPLLLSLLFIKHFLVDFVFQTNEQATNKGIYGNWSGLGHSFQHSVGTMIVMMLFMNPWLSLLFATLDGMIHYHIDWVKVSMGPKSMDHPRFWAWFGADQLFHAFTYIWFIWLLV
jgi:hypothetical protein